MKRILIILCLACVCQSLTAQITVTGKIVDEIGDELIGAVVQVEGYTELGAATDIDGSFSIKVESLPVTLIVSYIGYGDARLEVATLDTSLSVKLTEIILDGTVCCMCWSGPTRNLNIGPSYDLLSQSSGLTAHLQLPYLFGIRPQLFVDGKWNFTNNINDLNLRMERYGMPRIGRIATSLVGKYRNVTTANQLSWTQRIIGVELEYRGFELMLGYAALNNLGKLDNKLGPKNLNNDSTFAKQDGLHFEFSKSILGIFLRSEFTHYTNNNQYAINAEYSIPNSRIDLSANWDNTNGYESATLGLQYYFGW